jgi:glutathione S-transferase
MSELVVHHLPGAWGLPSVSPFCLKLDTYLRMVGIHFEVVIDATPFGAPKKKLPAIEHKGRYLGDSSFIIEYLEDEFGCDPGRDLSAGERAVAHAFKRLIEENLYWTMVYDRWLVDSNWDSFRDVVLGGMPLPARRIIGPIARRGVRRSLRGQGIGVHSREEIHAIGIRDLDAIADFLGDKPFLMGDTITEIDAAAYGLLANILLAPIVTPIRDRGLERGNLVDYVHRIQDLYYS